MHNKVLRTKANGLEIIKVSSGQIKVPQERSEIKTCMVEIIYRKRRLPCICPSRFNFKQHQFL